MYTEDLAYNEHVHNNLGVCQNTSLLKVLAVRLGQGCYALTCLFSRGRRLFCTFVVQMELSR